MTDRVFSIIDQLGAIGVGLLILLENVIPPLPSEAILPLAGFRAREGAINLPWLWVCATLGSLAGAIVLYWVGAWLGYERLHRLAGRRWFILCGQKDLDRGRDLFDRHGTKVVVLGRCVPFIRSVVSFPAGIARMPLARFSLLTAIGSGVWNAAFIALGWVLGDNWESVEAATGPIGYAVGGLVVAGLVVLAIRKARASSTPDQPAPSTSGH